MIKAIVLDIGGVLLRTEDRSGRQALEKEFNLPVGGADKLVFNAKPSLESTLGKVTPDKIWENVAEELSLTPQSVEEFKRAFWQGDQIDQEMLSYIISLKGAYKTALLSNAWLNTRQELIKRYQIIEGQTVDHILISSELGIAKPDQRIYHILADTLQSDFCQILFVDDFIENIKAAKSLGIQTILYQSGMDLITTIQSKLDQ
jgi:glucose-1-phosphatase